MEKEVWLVSPDIFFYYHWRSLCRGNIFGENSVEDRKGMNIFRASKSLDPIDCPNTSMATYFLNFTTFDLQIFPFKYENRPANPRDHILDPKLFLPLLIIYHALSCIALKAPNLRDYPARRDTWFYSFYVLHFLILAVFMGYLAVIHRTDYAFADNLGLLVLAGISFLTSILA